MQPLIGFLKLSQTRLQTQVSEGVSVPVAPLTPEQGVLTIGNWAVFDGPHISGSEGFGSFFIAPMLVDDELYAALRLAEVKPNARGFSLFLSPADFDIFADQVERTRKIFEDEGLLPARTAPAPPPLEGRGAALDRRPEDHR